MMMKFALFILFSSFVLNQTLRIDLGNGIVINPLDLSVLMLVIVNFTVNKSLRIKNIPTFIYPLFIFIAIGSIGLIINPWLDPLQKIASFLYALRLLLYILLFIQLYTKMRERDFVKDLMFFTGGVITFLGFFQYFFYPNLRNLYYLGWDDHLYRLFSTFLDPNFAGAYFALFCLYCLWRYLGENIILKKIMYASVGLSSVIALFLTYSRTGMIMLIVGIVVYLSFYKKLKILFFALISLIVLFFIFAGDLEGLNPLRSASVIARLDSLQNAFIIFLYNPVIGIGFNAYRYAQIYYGFRGGDLSLTSHADAGSDNSYLFVAATTGVIGLFLFFSFLKRIIESLLDLPRELKAISLSTLASILAGSIFTNILFYTPLLLWLFLVLSVTRLKKS
ncbi:MAG: hypothetical protein QG600_274 [Patescibacteria group bacterium]|nr:hypothetical protein [Patescibacteria group bacterium]